MDALGLERRATFSSLCAKGRKETGEESAEARERGERQRRAKRGVGGRGGKGIISTEGGSRRTNGLPPSSPQRYARPPRAFFGGPTA